MITIGVVGPADLVTRVVAVGEALTPVGQQNAYVALPYQHESQTLDLVRTARDTVDAFLFTGVIPYAMATGEDVAPHPAAYVSYNGATLLRSVVELLRLGHDVTRMSIDTLAREEVMETLVEAKLPTDHIQVLEYRPGLTSDDIAAFHRQARDMWGAKVAVTCLGSAYHAIETELHAVRLAPSRHSIRAALRELVLATAGQRSEDSQVVIGLVELPERDDQLAGELAVLGGALAEQGPGRYLVVTTRGPLEQNTAGFSQLPLLERLAERHPTVHIGLGLARTAAEAEAYGRRALGRARAVGPKAAIVGMTDDVDILLGGSGAATAGPGDGQRPPATDSLPLLARRVGLKRETLARLRELAPDSEAGGVTAFAVARHLGVEQRTARRILKRLERAGLAEPIGSQQHGQTGRPPTIYRTLL